MKSTQILVPLLLLPSLLLCYIFQMPFHLKVQFTLGARDSSVGVPKQHASQLGLTPTCHDHFILSQHSLNIKLLPHLTLGAHLDFYLTMT